MIPNVLDILQKKFKGIGFLQVLTLHDQRGWTL